MFKHILVATDGSERADKAISAALALAGPCGASVTALLVVPDYTTQEFAEVTFIDGRTIEELRKSYADKGRERLALKSALLGSQTMHVLSSSPVAVLVVK